MSRGWVGAIGVAILSGAAISFPAARQIPVDPERGPYARIALLRPHDGDTVDFEAGYMRHLDFDRQAKDRWVWYGWSMAAASRCFPRR
jgi:hypothetical protein